MAVATLCEALRSNLHALWQLHVELTCGERNVVCNVYSHADGLAEYRCLLRLLHECDLVVVDNCELTLCTSGCCSVLVAVEYDVRDLCHVCHGELLVAVHVAGITLRL